jgi:hypothetical protein
VNVTDRASKRQPLRAYVGDFELIGIAIGSAVVRGLAGVVIIAVTMIRRNRPPPYRPAGGPGI